MFNFLFSSEYIFSIFVALFIYVIYIPKRKLFIVSLLIGFLVLEIFWHANLLPGLYNYFLILIIFAIMLLCAFKVNFFQMLFLLTGSYSLQHLIYKITISLVFLFGGNKIWHSYYYFLIYFLVVGVTLPIFYYLYTRKFKEDNEIRVNSITVLLTATSLLFVTIFLSYWTQDTLLRLDNNLLFIQVNLYGGIICVFGIVLLFFNSLNVELQKENKTLELLLKKDEERYRLATMNAEKMNIRIHDLKHQIHQNNLNQDAVNDIENATRDYESVYYTQCKPLDIILSEKKTLCDKKQIQLFVTADGKLLNFIKSYQIYSLFGNLIDNAIESASKVNNLNLKYIKIRVFQHQDNAIIEIENYTSIIPSMKNGLPQTIKEDKENHGFGTKSVKAIVSLYHGYTKMTCENNIFLVKIMIPLSINLSNNKKSIHSINP